MITNTLSPSLSEDILQIWITRFTPWKLHTAELEKLLAPDEKKRLEKLIVENRRQDYLVSRGILRIILAQHLNDIPEAVKINIAANGKPYLPDSEIQFNISHSEDLFLCSLTLGSKTGIDGQQVYPIANMQTLIKNYFHTEEQGYLASIKEDLLTEEFFSLWTAKEAYLKATGEGFQRASTSFCVAPRNNQLNSFVLRDPRISPADNLWEIHRLNIAPAYQSAVAVERKNSQILQIPFSPADYY